MHVQSGIWSFRFKHSRGEDGLGMVTPLEASFDDLPRDVVTRITLRFSETTTNDYQRLLSELDGIPETTILHLHRLRQIVIQRPNHVFRIQRLDYHNPKRHALKKTTTINNSRTVEQSRYYSFNERIIMPKDDRREGRSHSVVELDFPVDAFGADPLNNKPALSKAGQYILAFLPLYQLPVQVCLFQNKFLRSNDL